MHVTPHIFATKNRKPIFLTLHWKETSIFLGDVSVLSADLVMDLGESLNPAIGEKMPNIFQRLFHLLFFSDVGQIEGAFVQGLGYVTMEQLIRAPSNGEILTTGPGTYKVGTKKN